ncbi:MazG nucleotide pyrophosphohydrolase domain-containing protein [Curtobacterium sp. PhB115]|uniref:MazG nucleotide pyrophosphohydrolase domain-containing protein n=1 Tax=Curtobacterium sp. PhB115 TaxID=2485173 RepID=UPI000F4D22DD|nr:MazG nucleotide pyrophosphohydrolase domain-containing protein [Curtobacterium sp. PhB115]ROP65351.1 NTP pyrophosphatase (non-canonical NTP hydrolase) [Curtobacterium sp. PhB115]
MDMQDLSDEVEAVSAHYAARHGIDRTDEWFVLKLGEEVGELTQAFLARSGQARRKGRSDDELEQGFRDEIADVLAQVLLIARHFDVPIDDAVREKWAEWHPDRMGSDA